MPVFKFIYSEDPAARTTVKSHVARKANHARRLRDIEAYQGRMQPGPKSLQCRHHASTSTPDTLHLDKPVGHQLDPGLLLPRSAELETNPTLSSSEIGPNDNATIRTRSDEQLTDPLTLLNTYASRVASRPRDFFWTMYSQLSTGDRNLLQWYLVAVPELSFGVAHNALVHPVRDSFFPHIGDSSEVLHSSLLISAANNPAFSHGEKGATRVLVQKGKTINLIHQALQRGQTALKDGMLYAVATTALAEDRLGNQVSCQIHLDGLKHLIRLRGGMKSLRKNFPLCGVLAWVEISVSNCTAPLARSQDSNATLHGAKASSLSTLEARDEEEIFCRFLTRLQRVQLSKRRSHDPVDHPPLGETDFLFRKGSPLLIMLGDSDQDSGVITSISRMNANNCQLACLFYINFMLCEFHGFPQLTTRFLVRLSSLLRQHGDDKIPRASLFVWVFVREIVQEDDDGKDEVDRFDWLIRMIRVARRLGPESSQMLHRALLDSLKIHEPEDAGMLVSNDLGIVASRVEMGSY